MGSNRYCINLVRKSLKRLIFNGVVLFSTTPFLYLPLILIYIVKGDIILWKFLRGVNMKSKFLTFFQNLIICISLCAIASGVFSPTVFATDFEPYKPLSGKTVSILGDSISSYENVSSGTAAETSNSTIKNNAVFFTKGKNGVYLEDTWWMQFINELGGTLLVNNSYSASRVYNPDAPHTSSSSYYKRCINLHDNTGENAGQKPDVIMVYLGYNDHSRGANTIGDYQSINYNTLIENNGSTIVYSEPKTTCEAYAIMLNKIKYSYPDAEVYCLNLPYRGNLNAAYEERIKSYNCSLKKIVAKAGFIYVDTFAESGYPTDATTVYNFNADYVHPNINGMDALTAACLNTFYKNSRYIHSDTKFHNITYNLEGVLADSGTQKIIPDGEDFHITLSTYNYTPFEVTVTSGDDDITSSCYKNGHIDIPDVTKNITISAKQIKRSTHKSAYRYETDNNNLLNIADDENTENNISVTSTENAAYYTATTPIKLNSNAPWSVVWKTNGKNSTNVILSAYRNTKKERNFSIVYNAKQSRLYFAQRINGDILQYGVDVSKHEIDTSKPHTYRLSNVYTPLKNNVINLYVDGKLIAPLTSHYINGIYQGENLSWCNDIDFSFGYMGAENSGLKTNDISFIQIWENTVPSAHVHNYLYTNNHITTCTSDGYIEHICECGESISDITEKAVGHVVGDWKTEFLPTVYAPGLKVKKCTVCSDIIKSKELAQLKTQASSIMTINNKPNGIKLTWRSVNGADTYNIYRREANTKKWTLVNTTNRLSFVDANVKNSIKYQYLIRVKNEAGLSEASPTKSIKFIKTPVIKGFTNTPDGINIKWNNIKGASSYRVYRKRFGATSWKLITTTKETSYLDKQTQKFGGVTYLYVIRAENGVLSGFNADGYSVIRLVAPVLNNATSQKNGIKIKWEESAGADGYYIFRKTSKSGWKRIGSANPTQFTYIDKTAKKGVTYTYTVRAYNGSITSSYDSAGITCKDKY